MARDAAVTCGVTGRHAGPVSQRRCRHGRSGPDSPRVRKEAHSPACRRPCPSGSSVRGIRHDLAGVLGRVPDHAVVSRRVGARPASCAAGTDWRRLSVTRGGSWCREVKARRGLPPHRYAADPVERPAGWPQNARSWTFVDPTPPVRRPASLLTWDIRVTALSSGNAVGGLLSLPRRWNRWSNAVRRAS